MANVTKMLAALLKIEREDGDKREVYVEIPESVRLYKIKKIHEEHDRVVLIARRTEPE
jgi:hypothetical protein